jgi:hypothetical protein
MKEQLLELIRNTALNVNELKKIIIKTLMVNHDIMKIKFMVDKIIKHDDISSLSEKDIELLYNELYKFNTINDKEKIEKLEKQLKEVKSQNELMKKQLDLKSQQFSIISDVELNVLYDSYINDNVTTFRNAFIIKHQGKLIMPKSFYIIERGE